jgi:hypothetical protein
MAKKVSTAKPTSEMTVVDRAAHVLKFDQRKADLAELATRSHRIVEITNTAGRDECHSARMALKNTRIEIEKAGKAAREDATAFSKAVISKEKELIDVIAPEEGRLQSIQDAWDAAREAERAEKVRVQQEAIERERRILEATHALPLQAIGKTAEQIQHILTVEAERDFDELPETIREKTRELSAAAVVKLTAMRDEKLAAEAEAKRLADERAELERLRKAQEEAQAAVARKADEERAEADRLAKVERERIAAEEKAERDRVAAAEKTERDRLAEIEREKLKQEAFERAERQAEEDRQREQAALKLKSEREEFERKRADAEKAERERAIADATLVGAAGEAVDLLTDSGFGSHIVTLKLSAALNRETERKAA